MARLSDVANVHAVFNPTTGEYKEFTGAVTMQQANAVSAEMISRNPQAKPSRGDYPKYDFNWAYSNLESEGAEEEYKPTPQFNGDVYIPEKTNKSGLYLVLGVLVIILVLNK